jgi:exo-beta-1,3-glucanase (GH17 family)
MFVFIVQSGVDDTEQNDVARAADFYLGSALPLMDDFQDATTAASQWQAAFQSQVADRVPDAKRLYVGDLGWPLGGSPRAYPAAGQTFVTNTRCGKAQTGGYAGTFWYEAFNEPAVRQVLHSPFASLICSAASAKECGTRRLWLVHEQRRLKRTAV